MRVVLLAALAALTTVAADAQRVRAPAPASSLARAEQTYAAMERWFGAKDGTGLYREEAPARREDRRYSYEWPFSQAHVAILDLAAMPGVAGAKYRAPLAAVRRAQMRYWAETSTVGLPGHLSEVVPPLGEGGHLYYDDNEWVGLADVQHHLFYGDAESLASARRIFELIRAGWSNERGWPSPGGVRWTQDPKNEDRNTVSNMPGAELGLRLYEITGEKAYLNDALRFYRWTNATLQRPDGLYLDNIKRDGSIDRRVFSYNQGVPVGVNVLLYRVTKEPRYLAEAKRIAAAAHAYYEAEGRIDRQPPPFNAIYFKNLLLLEAVTGGRRYRDAMRAYADRMWATRRDPKTGLTTSREGGRERAQLIDTAAMVQIEAVLAWREEDWSRLY